MSNRIIKHSSRYKGPMGDSRPPAEIFAEMGARQTQAREYQVKLVSVMDEILENAKLMSREGRTALIRDIVVDWLLTNDPDLRKIAQRRNWV